MRRLSLAIMIVVLGCGPAAANKDESLPELMQRADSARAEQRVNLSVEVARRQLHSADELFKNANIDAARSALKDVVKYSENAHDAAAESGKRLKDTEIALRKMAAKLRDIQRTLNLEDQPPVQAAVDRLEVMRTDLLSRMFGKKSK